MAAVCVFCASSDTIERSYLDLAYQTGAALAAAGHTLVSGGGRVGMMGAVANGARAGGGHTIGVVPRLLVNREVADTSSAELVVTADLAERKTVMLAKADVFLVLPGGIGTLDELFEVWTTAALDLHTKPVLLLDHEGFYAGLLAWLGSLVGTGFLLDVGWDRLVVVDSLVSALAAIAAQ